MIDSKADIVSINDVIQEVDGEDLTSILSSINQIDEIIGDTEHEHTNTIADIFVDKIIDSGANMSSISSIIKQLESNANPHNLIDTTSSLDDYINAATEARV